MENNFRAWRPVDVSELVGFKINFPSKILFMIKSAVSQFQLRNFWEIGPRQNSPAPCHRSSIRLFRSRYKRILAAKRAGNEAKSRSLLDETCANSVQIKSKLDAIVSENNYYFYFWYYQVKCFFAISVDNIIYCDVYLQWQIKNICHFSMNCILGLSNWRRIIYATLIYLNCMEF